MVVSVPRDLFSPDYLKERLKSGEVPLNAISWASENGYVELVRKLVALNADVAENDNYPLELASKNGHTEIVRILLEAGASTQASDDEGYCLRMAACNGYTMIANYLIQAGANPKANNYFALKLALENNNMEIVELLLDVISIERVSKMQSDCQNKE